MRYRPPHIPNFSRISRQFAAIAVSEVGRSVEEFAHEEVALFQDEIKQQVFPSFRQYPLTEAYARRKQKANADGRVMMATHWYVDHIRVWAWRPPTGRRATGWRIGFHHSVRARDLWGHITDITLDRLARVHEYGSADQHIPPRPHWRPHFAAMRERARALRTAMRTRIARHVTRQVRWGP